MLAVFTTLVKEIIENINYGNNNVTIDDKINFAAPKIFDFLYPVPNVNYKAMLENKILKHYYLREIGMETVGLWKLQLNRYLNEVMPYYLNLYETTIQQYDYLGDTNITEIYRRGLSDLTTINSNGNNTQSTNNNTNEFYTPGAIQTVKTDGTTLGSDLPQTKLDPANVSNLYANTAAKEDSIITTSYQGKNENNVNLISDSHNEYLNSGTNNKNVNESSARTRKGNSGARSTAELIMQYRNTLINIDMMIIDGMSDLFITLY